MQDRVVLITGASRGIGRAIALAFAARGARLALAARGPQDLSQVARDAEKMTKQAVAFEADLSDRSAPVRLVRDVERELGQIDILVNLTPMGRRVEPEEIAALATFLCSDEASSITGQAYNVDCGQVMF